MSTPVQLKYLRAFRLLTRKLKRSPSMSELAAEIGGSRQSAYRAVLLLTRDGHLVEEPISGNRSTYVLAEGT